MSSETAMLEIGKQLQAQETAIKSMQQEIGNLYGLIEALQQQSQPQDPNAKPAR